MTKEFIIILFFLLTNAKLDDFLYSNKCYDDGNHFTRWSIRAAIIVLIGVLFFDWKFIAAAALIFTGIYDYLLNIIRGLPIGHLGNNMTDRFWAKLGFKTSMIIKIILAISGGVLLIL